ncbi:hypothetical protein [Nesterenkonia sp.]|uniref:hypothetical protein n=1 Tax=Nesterenkonia sp. TaxID=704201 RepID=UPI0026121A0B|nr:hypothetical protein [Nesterenkonia sp.]
MDLSDYVSPGIEPFAQGSVKGHVFPNLVIIDARIRIDREHPDLPDRLLMSLPADGAAGDLRPLAATPPVTGWCQDTPVPVLAFSDMVNIPGWAGWTLATLPAGNLGVTIIYERRPQ